VRITARDVQIVLLVPCIGFLLGVVLQGPGRSGGVARFSVARTDAECHGLVPAARAAGIRARRPDVPQRPDLAGGRHLPAAAGGGEPVSTGTEDPVSALGHPRRPGSAIVYLRPVPVALQVQSGLFLTVRQRQCMMLVAEGLTNREIAARLHLEMPTVKSHLDQVFKKTQVSDRAGALLVCMRAGLIA
jgi:DNA-binding CsgD family transcriptional regulator